MHQRPIASLIQAAQPARLCVLWACCVGVIAGGIAGCSARTGQTDVGNVPVVRNSVELTPAQLLSVTVMPATVRAFSRQRAAVGLIDFDQDRTVQVSTPYQGRVVQVLAHAGERVHRGQLLFTIDSPDLVQAESTLIATAGTLELTSHALQRAQRLYEIQGMAQKDFEQAVSDQQAADGAYHAARDALRIFGKSDADMDRIVRQRRIESQMPIASPIDGVVTTRNAAPGMLLQPGSTAPFAVTDVESKWMLADVPEADVPGLTLGEAVAVKLLAYGDRTFQGRIDNIAEAADPATHRVRVRSQIADPRDELRAQMFATFTLQVPGVTQSPAVPSDAVVREGDGTMTVWVTTDRRHFARRTVRVGAEQDGYAQIVEGLQPGEWVAASGALFISTAAVQDAAQ